MNAIETKKFVRTEKRIMWSEIQAEIKRQTGKGYSTNYLQNIYHGRLDSAKVKAIIEKLINNK
jgi:hypothetical protein